MQAAVSLCELLIRHLFLHCGALLKFKVNDVWTKQTVLSYCVMIQNRKQIHLAARSVHIHFINSLSSEVNVV